MPRKGENIYKRKDGRWEGRYKKGRNGSKTIYGYVYAKTYSEVKRKLNQKRAMYSLTANYTATSCRKEGQFSQISDMWLKSVQSNVKESSWIKYRNILNFHLVPLIGMKSITGLDYEAVSSLCNELLMSGGKNHQGLSPKTVSDDLSVVKAVIKYADRMKFNIDRTALDVSVHLKPVPLRVFSVQEEQVLFAYLTENMDLTKLGILICMFTGIRIGELCALTWNDISFSQNSIHIRHTMQRLQEPDDSGRTTIQISEPKSICSVREIPIAKTLRHYLENYRTHNGYVLTGKSEHFIEPRTMQNRYKAILKKCNIQNASFHTLRHTFATRCIEIGFDLKSLSEILGHANVNITLDRYVHPSMDLKQKNIDKLSSLYAVK